MGKQEGIAKAGIVNMTVNAIFLKGDQNVPPPAFAVGLLAYETLGPDGKKPGQMVDHGDSGGGCFVERDDGVLRRRLVGVATTGYEEVLPKDVPPTGYGGYGLAARIDRFLPWLEKVAYTRPSAFSAPKDTAIPAGTTLPAGTFWDDDRKSLSLT